MTRILVIDDEASIRETLDMFLKEKGFEVRAVGTAAQGLKLVAGFAPQVIILDIRLPDACGLDLIKPINELDSHAKTIIITAHHDMETTIEAMRQGAYDYIHKPLDVDELDRTVQKAAYIARLGRQAPDMVHSPNHSEDRVQLVGKSRAMRLIFKTIGVLAANRASILVEGETGTGKEVIARVIHDRSGFREKPFVTVDCTTLVDTLMESELFGHERGAFTGAVSAKKGRLEMAKDGTIFFDEVGDLPPRLQAKLLRFLERREFIRVGGTATLHSQARIIAAANQSLEQLVREGRFRQDLLFRLKVVTIEVPPLRQRLEDLDEMAPYFLQRINKDLKTNVTKIEKRAMDILRSHHWPGNVRELINVLTKALIESRGRVLLAEAVAAAIVLGGEITKAPTLPPLWQTEKDHIVQVMQQTGWNLSAAARILGLSRPTLRKRLARYQVARP